MSSLLHDRELNIYRDLVEPPGVFEAGFTLRTFLGTLFVGLIMLPAAMYMHLMIGEVSLGPAAQWVTVLLFLEMAKRARSFLKPAELFILMAMIYALVGSSPVEGFFWRQYVVQSEAARSFGLDNAFPSWFAPTDPAVLDQRSFLAWEWGLPLLLLFLTQVVGRLDSLVLGYGLFRIASDVERLPFPMAPIQASGVLALSENSQQREGWRWRCFSIAAALGMAFGLLYVAVPAVSSVFLARPLTILPIPWWDTTVQTQGFFPATATGLSLDLANLFAGMAFPFFAVLGGFLAMLATMFLNPWLHDLGLLRTWEPGMKTVQTLFANNLDFYLSFGLGISLAVAALGFYQVFSARRERRATGFDAPTAARPLPAMPARRGDIRIPLVIGTYLTSSAFYILLSGFLLHWDFRGSRLLWVMLFFALVYVPIISYVSVRLTGLAGAVLSIPFIKEAAFILSGYRGLEIWLLPIPFTQNYGNDAVQYRVAELVGCSFRSIWAMNAVVVPLVFVFSLLYGQFIWSLGPIPSAQYPYAMEMWDFYARNQCLVWSSTSAGHSPFMDALRWPVIAAGSASGLALYMLLAFFGAPVLMIYGLVGGLGQTMPQFVIPQFAGAILGRYVLARRFGEERWRRYALVLFAGFGCGAGLIMMFSTGLRFLASAVYKLAY